jgi:hypothetical protein
MNMRGDRPPRAGGPVTLAFGLALAVALAAAPASAQVGPLTNQALFFNQASHQAGNYVDAQAGLIYTDNVDLTPNGSSDTLALLGLVADTSHQGPRLDYRLASDISLVKYLKGAFETRPYGYLDGSLDFKIVPGFFSWTARDTYVDAVIFPSQPATPDNLEGINLASTGPRFVLRPTLRTTITLDGIYSVMNSSSQSPSYVNIDNTRYAGALNIIEALSNTSSVNVGGDYQKVDFKDETINTNFKQADVSAGYSLVNSRTILNISAGYTKLRIGPQTILVTTVGGESRLETIDETPSGATYKFELSRVISPAQRVSFNAFQQFADAANLFRFNLDQPVVTTLPFRLATGEPFTDRQFGLDYRFQASRTALDLALAYIKELYEVNPSNNRDVKLASAFVVRQLSPVLHWDIGIAYEHQEFSTSSTKDEVNVITTLRWQLGERFALRFIYAHASLNPHGYQENQAGITVSYALVGTPQAVTSPAMLLPTSPMSSQYPAQVPQ